MRRVHWGQCSQTIRPDIWKASFLMKTTQSGHSSSVNAPMKAEDNHIFSLQANRTISRSIPGKLFMLNYLSHEQSSASITNRIISILAILFGSAYLTLYGTKINSYSLLTTMFLVVFPASFVYVHMGYWQVFILLAMGSLFAIG